MAETKVTKNEIETVLYNNATGTKSTITLSETSANFSYIEIYYLDELLSGSHSVKVYSPDGKKTDLNAYVYGDGTAYTNLYAAHADILISGTSLSWGHNGYSFTSSQSVTTHYDSSASKLKL